jgi:arginase
MRCYVNIIGVPIDLGSQRVGVDMGPNALRYAGLVAVLQQAGMSVKDWGDIQVPTPESQSVGSKNLKYLDAIVEVSERLAVMTAQIVEEGGLPLVLGGDHSLAIGSISGYVATACQNHGVVWIDAHPDCNTPETTISGNIHGMALSTLLGSGEPRLVNCHREGSKVQVDSVALVGIKDADPAEQVFLREKGLKVFSMDDINAHGIAHAADGISRLFSGRDLIVSLDLDVVDSLFAPGVGIRSHGGLTYREVKYLCRYLGQHFHIAGIDLVELNPVFDKDNQTAELAIELVMALLGQDYGDYQQYLRRQKM